eukprot:NODE_3645_length_387_cov_370.343195_g3082_i0.p4 GENE.NODE_3645_length_387_cov_370.343195_g3082_i0~~NODE_3645_length_387_cov_370.343195_g3082_i0.p4  ORF type:complete len:72 (+),score=26.45 NODE_3645_length_387_cov_370.343195_g3082_i0:157-372(+)
MHSPWPAVSPLQVALPPQQAELAATVAVVAVVAVEQPAVVAGGQLAVVQQLAVAQLAVVRLAVVRPPCTLR